jgi:uncharacterized protein (TIGR04255 family)
MNLNNPPIVEMFIGAQFLSKKVVDTTHFIHFWATKLQKDYPIFQEAAALQDVFEKFDESPSNHPPTFTLKIGNTPSVRYQFSNKEGDRIVQLQPTHLLLNWVRKDSDYPRFSVLNRVFTGILNDWVEVQKGNDFSVNQWELGYINFIRRGGLWTTLNDWHRISPLFANPVEDFSRLILDDQSYQWRFQIPEKQGRITLTVKQQYNAQKEWGMMLNITGRGPASSLEQLTERINMAHREILYLFEKFATEEAKNYWGFNK